MCGAARGSKKGFIISVLAETSKHFYTIIYNVRVDTIVVTNKLRACTATFAKLTRFKH